MRKWINLVEATAPPQFLYHGSPATNRADIMQNGLDASKSDTAETSREMGDEDWHLAGGIFFSNKPEGSQVGIDVWKVDVRGLDLQRDDTTEHEHLGEEWWATYTDRVIEPSRLTLLSTQKGK